MAIGDFLSKARQKWKDMSKDERRDTVTALGTVAASLIGASFGKKKKSAPTPVRPLSQRGVGLGSAGSSTGNYQTSQLVSRPQVQAPAQSGPVGDNSFSKIAQRRLQRKSNN